MPLDDCVIPELPFQRVQQQQQQLQQLAAYLAAATVVVVVVGVEIVAALVIADVGINLAISSTYLLCKQTSGQSRQSPDEATITV